MKVVLSLGCLLAGCSRGADVESPSASPQENMPETAAAEQPKPVAAPAPTAAVAARMGGAVVATGEYNVEVVASADGSVDAAVMTAAGATLPHADVSAFKVNVQGEGSARHEIALAWDAPRAVFHGRAAGDAHLVSGPLDVSLTVSGKVQTGKLELAVVLPRPQFGGRMIAVGAYSAEVVTKADGEIEVHLRDAAGAAIQAGAELELKLRAQGKAGAMQEIALRWDAPRARFVGKLEADAQLAAGPIELALRKGELAAFGRVEVAALVAPPAVGGSLDAEADAKAGIAAHADLKAKAKADAELAAKLKAEAAAAKKAQAKAKAELAALEGKAKAKADLSVKAPQPSLSVKAGATGSADAKAAGSAKAGTTTQASGEAKQQAGVKLGGGFSLGAK